jgi:peptide/nickel transport system substrate-binding protein
MARVHRLLAWLCLATIGLALFACGGPTTPTSAPAGTTGGGAAATPAGTPKRGGTLKAGLASDIFNLDPLLSGAVVDRQLYYNLYDSLVAMDTNLQIIPSLAESWDIPDSKTYVFHLRHNVKFHDGTDFNADAVKFNIERYLNDKNSRRKSELDTIQSVEVVDPYTVKFNLKAAFAPLLANLVDRAGMILSPKAIQAGGEDFTRKPIGAGTGAFKFVEWVKDDHITLERNPDYWKKDQNGQQLPYLDKITYRPITDETVLLTNLKTGDVDVDYGVPPKDYASVKSSGDLILQEAPGLSYSGIALNTQSDPFKQKELRQAVSAAIDRDQINKTIFFGSQLTANGPIPPSSWAYDPTLKAPPADIAKAKEYLKAAGKPDGFTLELKIVSGSPVYLQLTQLLKDQLAQAGIIMNITQLESSKAAADQQAGNFQGLFYGWSGRIDPDGNIYNQFRTGGSLNDTKYSNPQVDALLDQARATTDQAQRKTLYQQAQKIIVDDAAFAFYSFPSAFEISRPNVQGVQVYADYIMRFERTWLK